MAGMMALAVSGWILNLSFRYWMSSSFGSMMSTQVKFWLVMVCRIVFQIMYSYPTPHSSSPQPCKCLRRTPANEHSNILKNVGMSFIRSLALELVDAALFFVRIE
jgi:hypothetical protein